MPNLHHRACVEMTLSNGDVTRRCFNQPDQDIPQMFAHMSPTPVAESDRRIRGCYNINNSLVSSVCIYQKSEYNMTTSKSMSH